MTDTRSISLTRQALFIAVLLPCLLFTSHITQAQSQLEALARQDLSESLVTASLLSDDEVIQLGVWDFDPNRILGTDNEEIGSEDASAIRDSLTQFSFPWRTRLTENKDNAHLSLVAKLAYLNVDQDVQLENATADFSQHTVLSGSLGALYTHNIDEHWQWQARLSVAWMQYDNDFDFNSDTAKALRPFIDGLLTNYDADALMYEPTVRLKYRWQGDTARYSLYSAYHYLFGRSVNADIPAHDVRPQAWYWANGIEMSKPIFTRRWQGHRLWTRFSRVDVGGDLPNPMGTSHYYELGLAWLVDTPEYKSFLSNFGLGININYGSNLKGGTLILLYNFVPH